MHVCHFDLCLVILWVLVRKDSRLSGALQAIGSSVDDAQQAWPKRKRGPLSEASKEKERARNRCDNLSLTKRLSLQDYLIFDRGLLRSERTQLRSCLTI